MEKKCVYCGEFNATKTIFNPNSDEEKPFWDVCESCEKVIKEQQKLAFGLMLKNIHGKNKNEFDKHSLEYADKLIEEARQNLNKLAQESFTSSISVVIKKKKGC